MMTLSNWVEAELNQVFCTREQTGEQDGLTFLSAPEDQKSYLHKNGRRNNTDRHVLKPEEKLI